MPHVTIGLRAHTGWAVAVALAGPLGAPAVVDRRRLDLTDPEVPRQAFHVAADLDADAAEELVERATRTAETLAERAVRGLVPAARRGRRTRSPPRWSPGSPWPPRRPRVAPSPVSGRSASGSRRTARRWRPRRRYGT